jgi:hypothetical protein
MAAPAASAATIAQGGQSHQNVQASPHVMDPVWFKWSAYTNYDVCVEHGQLLVNFPFITTFQCLPSAQVRGLPQLWDLWLYGYPDPTATCTLKPSERRVCSTTTSATPPGGWQGWGTPTQPPGSIRDIAATGMPDGDMQLAAMDFSGQGWGYLYHDIRYADGQWQGWRQVAQPPVSSASDSDVTIAGMPNGDSHVDAETLDVGSGDC